MRQFVEKHFRLLVAVPIFLLVALQLGSALRESSTFDEGVHLAAGYRYWRTGTFNMNVEHPPLQKLVSSAPLLFLNPPIPTDEKLLLDQSEYARAFLYSGPFDADRLFLLGRIPTIIFSALLAIALASAARHYFGIPTALVAVWLFALDPTVIAHGHLITTDMASALFFFLTVVVWVNYLLAPSLRLTLLAALLLGLALTAKFSMLLLLPLLPALALVHLLITRPGWPAAARTLAAFALAIPIAAGIILLAYAPESWRVLQGRPIAVTPETIAGVALPPHTYFTGVRTLIDHNNEGHPSYLLGKVADTGWWYYFPVVFAVKSPTALILLLLLVLPIAFWRLPRLLHDPVGSFTCIAMLLPPLVYFGVTLTSHINLGVRHLLPIYPFLYMLCAAALVQLPWPRLATVAAFAIVLFQTVETLAVFPEYLAYFNLPAGGAKAGPRYLLDSNLDWGQDLKKIKTYVDQNKPGTLCLDYFGSVDPKYYGIQFEYLPKSWDHDERERLDCLGAISLTLLNDLYIKPGSYAWLRQRAPVGIIGSSIYLYDLRKLKKP